MFDPGRCYRAPEVVRLSCAPRAYVYEALDSGELRAIRRGRVWLIPGNAALEWIAGLGEDAEFLRGSTDVERPREEATE